MFGFWISNNQLTEIKCLGNLTNLATLYLNDNTLSEIKGLENLTNLVTLYFSNNQLTEIKGLENLTNLKNLLLGGNQIPKKLIDELGCLGKFGRAFESQKFVEHCMRKEIKN